MQRNATLRSPRQLSFLATAIVAIATPATLALSYYHMTGDPTFRPLAVTIERLISQGVVDDDNIYVRTVVTTDGTARGNLIGDQLGKKLDRAFYGKGLTSRYRLHAHPNGPVPQILFIVDGIVVGPFTPATAPHGVRVATEAANIARQERGNTKVLSPQHSW